MSLPVMLITGTSRGLGRNLAEYYSNNGYFVIGCSRSEHTFYSSNYQHYQIDLAQPSAASHLFKQIKEDNYKIGCLINNAGISNSVGQYNNELSRQEVIANAQNRARNRSGKGEAIGSMGSNIANQMMDNKKGNMDQETLQLMMKYYNDPQFKKYLEESGFNKKKTGK